VPAADYLTFATPLSPARDAAKLAPAQDEVKEEAKEEQPPAPLASAGPLLAHRRQAGRGRHQRKKRGMPTRLTGDALLLTAGAAAAASEFGSATIPACVIGVTASPQMRALLRGVARFYQLALHPLLNEPSLAGSAASAARPVVATVWRTATRADIKAASKVSLIETFCDGDGAAATSSSRRRLQM